MGRLVNVSANYIHKVVDDENSDSSTEYPERINMLSVYDYESKTAGDNQTSCFQSLFNSKMNKIKTDISESNLGSILEELNEEQTSYFRPPVTWVSGTGQLGDEQFDMLTFDVN